PAFVGCHINMTAPDYKRPLRLSSLRWNAGDVKSHLPDVLDGRWSNLRPNTSSATRFFNISKTCRGRVRKNCALPKRGFSPGIWSRDSAVEGRNYVHVIHACCGLTAAPVEAA